MKIANVLLVWWVVALAAAMGWAAAWSGDDDA